MPPTLLLVLRSVVVCFWFFMLLLFTVAVIYGFGFSDKGEASARLWNIPAWRRMGTAIMVLAITALTAGGWLLLGRL